jgi:transposase
MAKKVVMEAIYERVAGLDVHKESVVACRRRLCGNGQAESEVQQFGTTTRELKRLGEWLSEWEVCKVAMESTGVYWQPVWNILHERFKLLLANAYQLKKVPGRKTDVLDAEWLAQLMQCGLLRGSFVPSEQIHQWRDLCRQRTKLCDQHTAVVNRIQKTLEQCNIKMASVVSDLMGVSGRAILQALAEGEGDVEKMVELAKGSLRGKRAALVESLEGRVTEHEQWLLRRLLKQVEFVEAEIREFDQRIASLMVEQEEQLRLLDTIDGVGRRGGENLLAEIGCQMSQFPTAEDLSSWAGVCPGNHQSAQKRLSGKTPAGNKWLKRTLIQAAWAATRTKDSYLAAQYRRLAGRRGRKRAIVAVGHSILQAVYYILRDQVEYRNLGGDYFDQVNEQRTQKNLVKRLEKLGYEVELRAVAQTA